jgi:hypothetical protein
LKGLGKKIKNIGKKGNDVDNDTLNPEIIGEEPWPGKPEIVLK